MSTEADTPIIPGAAGTWVKPADAEASIAPAAPAPPISETATVPLARTNWPSVKRVLDFPLEREGEQITEIVIAEPDLEAMERILDVVEQLGLTAEVEVKLTVKQLRPLLAAFTGIDAETLKRLHFKDVMALSELMAPLLEGLAT